MSVLAPGVFSAHSAVLPPLESKEAQDSVLNDVDSLSFSAKELSQKLRGVDGVYMHFQSR